MYIYRGAYQNVAANIVIAFQLTLFLLFELFCYRPLLIGIVEHFKNEQTELSDTN